MIVRLPDGSNAEFPDDMKPQEIEAVLQKQFPAPTQQAANQTPSITDLIGQGLKDFGQGVVEQLPTAGMMAGGAVGALGGGLGAIPGAALGAGIGAAGRNLIKNIQGSDMTPAQNLENIGKETGYGAMAEMGGPILAKGIQKVISPFAGTVAERAASDPAVKAALGLAEQGAGISPETIAGTKSSRFFDWMAEKVWPASSLMADRRQGLQKFANGLKDEFVASRGLFDTSKGGVNAAWDNWVNMAGGPAAPYEMPQTAKALQEAMNKPFAMQVKTTTDAAGNVVTESIPQGMFWKKYAPTLQNTLETQGQATVQDIRDILNVLNPTAAKGAERTARMKIADAIMEDLGASGNDQMVEALAQAREGARLQRIAAPLQNLFNRSMKDNIRTGTMDFNPDTFVNLWQQQRDKFLTNKNYSAEDVRAIDAFADKMKALVPDMARLNSFNPSLNQLNFQNPLPVLGMMYAKPITGIPVGMDAALAQSLMNPNGIMRRFLTTGFNPPTLSTKVGLQKGLEATNE